MLVDGVPASPLSSSNPPIRHVTIHLAAAVTTATPIIDDVMTVLVLTRQIYSS